jgi:hypothetical protein
MFHLPTNDGHRSLCGHMEPGDLVRMTNTNVDCVPCIDLLDPEGALRLGPPGLPTGKRNREVVFGDTDTLLDALERQMQAYLTAFNEGRPGKAHYALTRVQMLRQQMTEQDRCCRPYPPAKHTATCPTVIHAPLPWAPADAGLTACGVMGPIGNQLPVGPYPNCERCLPAHMQLDESR